MTEGDQQGSAPSPASASTQPGSGWSVGRVLGMVFASIGGLIGLALLVGGAAVLAAYAFGRDDGYFNSDRKPLKSPSYAITTKDIDLGTDQVDWAPDQVLGKVRVQVDSKRPVFVGIGPDEAVDRYLGGVAHAELLDLDSDPPKLEPHPGRAPRAAPAAQDFWVAKSQGPGLQQVTWDAEFGRWTAVVMNANAARGIDVEADAGVKLDWAIWAGLGMLALGLVMSAGAVLVILLIGRGAAEPAAAQAGPQADSSADG